MPALDFDKLFADFDYSQPKTERQASSNTTTTTTATKINVQEKPSQESSATKKTSTTYVTQSNIKVQTPSLKTAQDKMANIANELNNLFVEREQLITLMQLSICTGSNLLMLGPPGSAKTALAQELCSRIDNANYFQWMLNKTSDPSEILGSFSVKEMENDKFVRVIKGKLPEAHIGFIDEVFKSNAPTLNALLTIMNEHTFYNDGIANKVPLISMFGASNEGPEDDSLNALYDRFIFRINVQYVHDAANKRRMYNNYVNKRSGALKSSNMTKITLNEIYALQRATEKVNVSKDVVNKFIKLISMLENKAIHASDRRQNECFKIMQGNAILQGRDEVILEDFKPLVYILWEKEDDISVISDLIEKIINPYDDKIKEIKNQFETIRNDVDKITDPQEKIKRSIEAKATIEKLTAKANALINSMMKNNKPVDDLTRFRDEMISYNQKLISDALGTTFSEIDFNVTDDSSNDGYF